MNKQINALERARVPGTRLKITETYNGWIANYELHVQGVLRRKNINSFGETVAEAVQAANNKLAEYIKKHRPAFRSENQDYYIKGNRNDAG